MKSKIRFLSLTVLGALALWPPDAQAQSATLFSKLEGYQEVPAIHSRAIGKFNAEVSSDETSIEFTLKYDENLTGDVTQAHIHFAQEGVNGGIMIFLCSNLGNGPVGTPACPAAPAVVSGTLDASDMVGGAAAQGISAGQFGRAVRVIRNDAGYVNVHTTTFPGGEIRGQIDYTAIP